VTGFVASIISRPPALPPAQPIRRERCQSQSEIIVSRLQYRTRSPLVDYGHHGDIRVQIMAGIPRLSLLNGSVDRLPLNCRPRSPPSPTARKPFNDCQLDGGPVNPGKPYEVTMLAIARRIVAITASASPPELRPLPTDDPQHRQPDITRTRQLLGWQPHASWPTIDRGLPFIFAPHRSQRQRFARRYSGRRRAACTQLGIKVRVRPSGNCTTTCSPLASATSPAP
jgi:hypothetical protein